MPVRGLWDYISNLRAVDHFRFKTGLAFGIISSRVPTDPDSRLRDAADIKKYIKIVAVQMILSRVVNYAGGFPD